MFKSLLNILSLSIIVSGIVIISQPDSWALIIVYNSLQPAHKILILYLFLKISLLCLIYGIGEVPESEIGPANIDTITGSL